MTNSIDDPDGPAVTPREWADKHTGGLLPSQIIAGWLRDPNGRVAGVTPMQWVRSITSVDE